jgi:hypothetical protein
MSQQGNNCLCFVSSRCDLHASAHKKREKSLVAIKNCDSLLSKFFFKFPSGHWGEKFCLVGYPSVKVGVQKSLLLLATIEYITIIVAI